MLRRVSRPTSLLRQSVRMASTKPNVTSMHSQPATSTVGYAEDDVLFSNENLARVITLNRPKKLNSLNTSMVSKITPRLLEYAKSNVNNMVILNSTSPKGLCAGGDVAECAAQIKKGNPAYASDFFQREYNLNYLISIYKKPYVALMDGITMGGGVGLSVHAPFRIATERTKLAMPEMDIGFFPDVGTTFFLPRLDDKIGYYYALTGEILSGLDAYFAGFATHYVPSDRLPALVKRLSNLQPPVLNDQKYGESNSSVLLNAKEYYAQVNHAIEEFCESKVPESYKYPLSVENIQLIDKAFSTDSFDEALAVFEHDGSEFAQKTFKKLSAKSPTSLRVGFELMKRSANNTIDKQFELELVTATNMMFNDLEVNDFVKGVSHKLIDKIKEPFFPEWTPVGKLSGDYINRLMRPSEHTRKLETPLIQDFYGVSFSSYPHHMGLPNNSQVEAYITGNDGSGRSYLPTPNEVVKHFKSITSNKMGVQLQVEKILALHGELSTYDNKYVSWKK